MLSVRIRQHAAGLIIIELPKLAPAACLIQTLATLFGPLLQWIELWRPPEWCLIGRLSNQRRFYSDRLNNKGGYNLFMLFSNSNSPEPVFPWILIQSSPDPRLNKQLPRLRSAKGPSDCLDTFRARVETSWC